MINKKIFLLITWIGLQFLYIVTSAAIGDAETETNRQDIINFVKEIKQNIDTTVNPCEDFATYACGHMKDLDKPVPFPDIQSYFEKFYINNEPTSDYEHIVRKQFLDCKKFSENSEDFSYISDIYNELDFLKKLGKFSVRQDNLSSKTVAELEAEIVGITLENFFKIYPNQTGTNFILEPGIRLSIFKMEEIFQSLSDNSVNSQDIKEAVNKISQFVEKFIKLYESQESNEDDDTVIKSFDKLIELLPSKHFDWSTFVESLTEIWDLKKHDGKNNVHIKQLNLLKEIIQLIDNTDIQTIVNFQIYQVFYLTKIKFPCILFIIFNQKLTLKKIWDENLTDRTIERYTNFLDNFENVFNETVEKIPSSDIIFMENIFKLKHNVLKNHKKLITEEDIQELYENYDLEKPYKSANKFFKNGISKTLDELFDDNSNDDLNKQFLLKHYDRAIELDIKNKPNFYFNSILQYDFWFEYLRKNRNLFNMTVIDKCLYQINEYKNETNYDYFANTHFMNAYAGLKLVYNSLITDNKVNNEIDLIKDLIEPEKLFFINMGQHVCQRGETDNESATFRAFRNLKEFAKVFSCPVNSKMNQIKDNVCDLGFCYNVFPYDKELIPFSVKGC